LCAVEEGHKCKIAELEREQEALVDKIGFISSKAMLAASSEPSAEGYTASLETRAAELAERIAAIEETCRQRREELERLREATREQQARSQALRQSYDELQKLSDERVFRVPEGATTPPVVSA